MTRLLGVTASLPALPLNRRGKGLAVSLIATVGIVASLGLYLPGDSSGESIRAGTNVGMKPDVSLRAARARAVATARAHKIGTRAPLSQTRERTADQSHAPSLFAAHSWYVPPPPPPPVAPPPPAAPEPPPFPYTFVGSYAPVGAQPVFFLSRADRVIDAHVGDRLDGVYEFESAGSGTLVFNYLPLNIRQSVPVGASQ